MSMPRHPICAEGLESRLLLHNGHDHAIDLTIDAINALPNDSPVPFDMHVRDPAVRLQGAPAAPPAPWTTILNSGPIANRVDIVLVGDGYTAADLPTYSAQAQTFVDTFFNDAPLNTYKSLFNVHRVDVTSNQSGVDNDPTQGIFRDTALDMAFWCSGIERLLCVNVSKAYSFANSAPQVDQVIALGNSTKYGGAGYPSNNLGTYSGGNGSSIEIARHEFGHSFADLADEYDYGGATTYTGGEPAEANISIYTAGPMLAQQRKWHRWLDLANVDTFEGANYSQFGIYRPTFNSKMRALNQPFEEVNVEQFILKLYQAVDPIDSATPPGTYPANTTFTVDPIDPIGHPLSVQWLVDGTPIDGATGLNFNPSTLNLSGTHTLKVRVVDTTSAVRDEAARAGLMTQEKQWTFVVPVSNGIWTGNGDGANWSDANNWSNNTLPGVNDDVVINKSGSFTVNLANSFTSVKSITLGGAGSTPKLSLTANGTRLLKLGALSITLGASLDLNDNDMIVDYSGSRSPTLDAIQSWINSARAGGAWTGSGITSSAARNNPNQSTTLGAIEATQYPGGPSFDGVTLDNTMVLVKYTYYGDTDFNGKVDGADYARIDSTFNQETATQTDISGWFNGDFDGNGKVDGADYALIDAAFNSQGAPLRPAHFFGNRTVDHKRAAARA